MSAMPDHSVAERAVLGACLLGERVPDEILGWLSDEHFLDPSHQMLWRVMVKLTRKNLPITVSSIYETSTHKLDLSYLTELVDST